MNIRSNAYKYRTILKYNFILFVADAAISACPCHGQDDIVSRQILAALCYFCSGSVRTVLSSATWRYNRPIVFTKMAKLVSWKIVSVPHAPPDG